MEKDIAGKNSNDIFFYNENSTIKKYITDYSDKILHASSPFITIKNKKLQLPKVCSIHSKGKKQIQLAIQDSQLNKIKDYTFCQFKQKPLIHIKL